MESSRKIVEFDSPAKKKLTDNKLVAPLGLAIKGGGKSQHVAVLLATDLQRLKHFEWLYDPKSKQAYRELKIAGKPRKSFLHREAIDCVFGDGNVVATKDGNYLNCARSNLFIKHTRTYSSPPEGKFFPLKIKQFLSFIKKRHKGSQIANLLDIGSIETYNSKEIVIAIDGEESTAVQLLKLQDQVLDFLVEQFAFKGKVSIIRKIAEPQMVMGGGKAVPIVAPLAISFPEHMPATIMSKLKDLAGINDVTHISFAFKERNKIHKFNYVVEEIQQHS